jgi:hypothetical protein
VVLPYGVPDFSFGTLVAEHVIIADSRNPLGGADEIVLNFPANLFSRVQNNHLTYQ